MPLAPVHAGAGGDHSDVASVLSDHGSDDEALKALVVEARELGFCADADVKRTIRGKRHKQKQDLIRAREAERETRRAAFLAKIGQPTAPKEEPATAVAGAGVASAAGSARSGDGEHDKDSKIAGAKVAAPEVIDPASVSAERLAWRVIRYESPEHIAKIVLILNIFPAKERSQAAEHLRSLSLSLKLITHLRGDTDTFDNVLITVPAEARLSFLMQLERGLEVVKAQHEFHLFATALSRIAPDTWGSMIDALIYCRKLLGDQASQDSPEIINALSHASVEDFKAILDYSCALAGPFSSTRFQSSLGQSSSYFAKITDYVARIPKARREACVNSLLGQITADIPAAFRPDKPGGVIGFERLLGRILK